MLWILKQTTARAFPMRLIYGEVHGMKKDENGSALAGATIGLFYPMARILF